ncbi:MAG: Dabb family protein [Defluviitaleaceae bacterium]|nr:Dabb family protein [Defluviitaleaceae bacterium]
MLRHIVMWNYKAGLSERENKANAKEVKSRLEALKGKIKEIVEMKVYINELSSSNMDIIFDSVFENEETMSAYKIHPEHVKISEFISSVLQNRTVIDYYEE